MQTPAQILKHPLHPMLIALPIGFLVFSLISDIALRLTGNPAWMASAYYSLGAGIVAGLVAAIPGLIDWLSIKERQAKQIGVFHMVSNVSALVIFGVSFWMRSKGAAASEAKGPLILSIIAMLLLSVGGWLGGSLVYKHRVAVHE